VVVVSTTSSSSNSSSSSSSSSTSKEKVSELAKINLIFYTFRAVFLYTQLCFN
jgi:hypothetical protein